MKINKNSKYLLYSQALSFMGDYCALPALLILSTYYQDYWITSAVIVAKSLPMLIQPFLGALIDKYNKIKIMFYTDIIRFLVFFIIGCMPLGKQPILFIILLFIAYGSGVLFNPARLSMMSLLKEDIKYINIVFARYTTIFIIGGASFGIIFLFLHSIKLAIIFNSLTYLVSSVAVIKIKIPSNVDHANNNKKFNFPFFIEGIREISRNKYALNALFIMMSMALMWGIVYSFFPAISDLIEINYIGNFLLTMCIGIGGFLGTYLVKYLGFYKIKGIFLFCTFCFLAFILYIFSTNFLFAVIAATFFFMFMEYGEILAKVKIQEFVNINLQGRLFAISEALIGLTMSIGSTLINFLDKGIISILIIFTLIFLFLNTLSNNQSIKKINNQRNTYEYKRVKQNN